MCTWLEVEGTDDTIHTVGEMAEALKCFVADIPTFSGEEPEVDYCLCDIDLDAAGEKFGYKVEWFPDDGFDCRMTLAARQEREKRGEGGE